MFIPSMLRSAAVPIQAGRCAALCLEGCQSGRRAWAVRPALQFRGKLDSIGGPELGSHLLKERVVVRQGRNLLPFAILILLSIVLATKDTNDDEPAIDAQEMIKAVQVITPVQIELIGSKMVEKMLNHLGPNEKARIEAEIWIRQAIAPMEMNRISCIAPLVVENQDQPILQHPPFLSDSQFCSLFIASLNLIKDELEGFKVSPHLFVQKGMTFQISDDEPVGLLAQAAKKQGIAIDGSHVLHQYCITLEIDPKESHKRSQLAFTIVEASNGIAFSRESFALGDLDEMLRASMEVQS
jgi:hypothetical protein